MADPEDADAAEGVVETDGVERVEAFQRIGDLPRGRPVGCPPLRQAEPARDEVDVRVGRDDEAVCGYPWPEAEVERVAADHPAQVEVPPLAGRALRGVGKEEAGRGAFGQPAPADGWPEVECQEAGHAAREKARRVLFPVAPHALEESADGAVLAASLRDDEQERGRVLLAVESVAKAGEALPRERCEVVNRVEVPGRVGPESVEHLPDVRLDRGDPSIGEGRRNPGHDLAVLGIGVGPNEDDGIALGCLGAVRAVEQLELFAEQALPWRQAGHGKGIPHPN